MEWFPEFSSRLFPQDPANLRINEAFLIKHNYIPRKLFKYREFDIGKYSLKNLMDGTIWLAHPSTFNDPYDCHFSADLQKFSAHIPKSFQEIFSQEQLKRIDAGLSQGERLFDITRGIFLESLSDKMDEEMDCLISIMFERLHVQMDGWKDLYKVCCFSKRLDSILMWSHYSKNHTGFCIEYDVKELGPNDHRNRFMYPVIYQDQVFDCTGFLEPENNKNNLRSTLVSLIKAKDWAYEEEWRLVIDHGIYKSERGVAYNMPLPKAVYLGSMATPENSAEISEICKKNEIPLFKMDRERNRFNMIYKTFKPSLS